MFFHILGVSGTIGSGKSVRAAHVCRLVSQSFDGTFRERSMQAKKRIPTSKTAEGLRGPLFPIHAEHISADKEAHRLYAPGTPCYYEIVKEFGSEILRGKTPLLSVPTHLRNSEESPEYADKLCENCTLLGERKTNSEFSFPTSSSVSFSSLPEINRKQLGKIVFSNPLELEKLNRICRKRIEETILASLSSIKENSLQRFRESGGKTGGAFVVVEAAILGNLELIVKQCDDIWLLHCDRDIAVERVVKRDKMDVLEALKRVNSQKTTDDMLRQLSELCFGGEILCVDTSKGTVEQGLEEITELFHRYWERKVNRKFLR